MDILETVEADKRNSRQVKEALKGLSGGVVLNVCLGSSETL